MTNTLLSEIETYQKWNVMIFQTQCNKLITVTNSADMTNKSAEVSF